MTKGMKPNSYDYFASYYDRLANLLGKSYRQSKLFLLEEIKEGDKVLYLGGGTGANLPLLLDAVGSHGIIYYIEASSKMIDKARNRVPAEQVAQVIFLHQEDFSLIPQLNYDVVLTQFFLDILPNQAIDKLFEEIEQRTGAGTRWIFVDFFPVQGKHWLIFLMIWFFRIGTGNPRTNLPNYNQLFSKHGWEVSRRHLMKKGFIQAWLLQKIRSY